MSSYSSIIKRSSVSSAPSMADIDGPIVTKRNFQVYRGMSPTTASRIESRVAELEEALESERAIHLRNERELAEANAQLMALNDRADESDNQLIVQIDYNKKKDQELSKLRKDFELASISHETEMANVKRRHQELLNDLNDQLERATKNKSKSEKDKHQITIEIENLNTSLENVTKEKNYVYSKLETAEEQARKFKSQVDELNNVVADLRVARDRLALENAELGKQLRDFELNSGSVAKSRSQLQVKLESVTSKLEDVTSRNNQLEGQYNSLQDEYNKILIQLEEQTEAVDSLRNQNQKLAGDYSQLKSKYDKEVVAKAEENEDMKRKFNAKVAELEGLLEQAKSRAAKLEKDKNKLNIDVNEITIQLDEANAVANDCMKRMKQAEHSAIEWQRKFDDLNVDLTSTRSDNDRNLLELTRLKALADDQHAKIDQLNREVQKLTDALKESESSNRDLGRQNQDLLVVKAQLLGERDSLFSELSEARDAVKDLEGRCEASSGALHSLKVEWEAKLRERDEELESQRRHGQRGVDEMQRTMIELETRYKNESGRLRKKYEAEQQEINIQIDALNRNNADLAKNNKILASRIRELEISLESEKTAAQEAKNSTSLLERKLIAANAELEDLRAQLEASERARRNAESELTDSSSSSQQINITIANLSNDKKRLEADCQNFQRELHEILVVKKSAEDRADNLQGEVSRLNEMLRLEQDRHHFAEAARKQLEVQVNELTFMMEDKDSQREGRKAMEKLKLKVQELQAELDLEQRRSRETSGELRKAQKSAQDFRLQFEEEHRLNGELNEQLKNLLLKVATLKREIEESEEVLGITMGKYRKVQQQLEEAERRADRAESNVTIVRHTNILPRAAGIRSVSVNREITRSLRM